MDKLTIIHNMHISFYKRLLLMMN